MEKASTGTVTRRVFSQSDTISIDFDKHPRAFPAMQQQVRRISDRRLIKIKNILEELYNKYNHRHLIKPDPLQFVYQYDHPSDREIVGLLSADLAYGRVEQIQKSLINLFERMGDSPYDFVRSFGKTERKQLNSFKHRFTTGSDISDLLTCLKKVLNKYNSIEEFFIQGYNPSDRNIIGGLKNFCDSLVDMYVREHNGKASRGLKYLLVNPADGSACKRLNLFLRWMVRDDDVDAGLWKTVDKTKLIVPIDVHMCRLCRILGFHNRKAASFSTAIQITECFAEIEPSDPAKYDFALSRIGIVENCNGQHSKACRNCELFPLCRQ